MINVTIGNNLKRSNIIVSENTTIRKALEDNGIDYTRGTTSLDGATLAPGQMDKSFAELGVTERCYLLNVVKADNAAVIKIVGGAAVVESAHSLEDLKKIEKYRPDSLALYEGEGAERHMVFLVGSSKGKGNIGAFGAEFGETTTEDGKATITILLPEGTKEPKKWVEDNIGVAILKLNKVEAQYAPALADVADEQAAVRAAITVM